jgi:asparagine synthase (glutamine-hydrolysing)
MPGICGIVGKTTENSSAELAEMLRRMKHYPWYVEESYLDVIAGICLGRLSLGFVNTAKQPAFNEDGSILAVMDGELHDYDEQRCMLVRAGHQFKSESHAELLLHGYEESRHNFFRGLHGTFVAAIWDVRHQRLIVTNDRFGMKPLYYAKLPGKLLLASEIKALLVDRKVSREKNLQGIAQFLTFGQFLGEDTLLDSVRVLPAAGWLSYDVGKDRVTLDRYWRLPTSLPPSGLSEAELLDRLDESFKQAVDRCVRDTKGLGISLSGGLDSRTILATIDHDHTPVTSVCIGVEGSMDHRSAKQLAALSNRHHYSYVLNDEFMSRFLEHLTRMVQLTDGHYLSQCIIMPTLPVYRDLGIQVLLRGHAGELLHMDKAYQFSLDRKAFSIRREAALEEWLYQRLRTYLGDKILGSLFAAPKGFEMENLARDSLRACLNELEGVHPMVHRVWHLFITQRLRRETALSMVKFGSLFETRLPYLDHELIELLMSAPPELKLSDKIQSYILHKRRPAFLNVVNSNTGTRLQAGRLRGFYGNARLRVLAKLKIKGYQPYERLGNWLRNELKPVVEELLLSDQCLGRGLLNPPNVRTIVHDHLSGRSNHTHLLMALMIFELGQRELTDGESSWNVPVEPPISLAPVAPVYS